MTALVCIALVLVGLAVGASAQLRRYPGGRRAAFGAELREERRQLASARRRLGEVKRSLRRERSAAEGRIRATETGHRARVRDAEHALDLLRRPPGRGELLRRVGQLSVYQHVVVHGSVELPLDGLRARAEPRARLLLLPARGASRRVSFPDDAEVDQAVVRSLVSLIELAAATERLFAGRRAEEIAEAESTVAAVRADRGEVEAARKELAAVLASQEADPRVPPALGALERARKNWFTTTGAWPPP